MGEQERGEVCYSIECLRCPLGSSECRRATWQRGLACQAKLSRSGSSHDRDFVVSVLYYLLSTTNARPNTHRLQHCINTVQDPFIPSTLYSRRRTRVATTPHGIPSQHHSSLICPSNRDKASIQLLARAFSRVISFLLTSLPPRKLAQTASTRDHDVHHFCLSFCARDGGHHGDVVSRR